jgi:hypothetical protein
MTRVCATTGSSGVAFGTQIAWLSISTSGWPLDKTRKAATAHCAVTQGTGPPATLNGQAAITYGAVMMTVGWPLTSTRGFGAVGVAMPP